jgi:hypothetical protein
MPISMNIEKYDLATKIIIKLYFHNMYKNTIQDDSYILKFMKKKVYFKILQSPNEEQRAIFDDMMCKKMVCFNDFLYEE